MLSNGTVTIQLPEKETPRSLKPGSVELELLNAEIKKQLSEEPVEYYLMADREEVYADEVRPLFLPHDHGRQYASYHLAREAELGVAIESVFSDMHVWSGIPWQNRAAFLLKCAQHLKENYRERLTAAIILSQSKRAAEAELDFCGILDALRFSAYQLSELYHIQPPALDGVSLVRQEYEALDNFVAVISGGYSTALAVNQVAVLLATGNHVIWNAAPELVPALSIVIRAMLDLGLPAAAMCFMPAEKEAFTEKILKDPALSGVSFTGELEDFEDIWRVVGANISAYRSFPVIQGDVNSPNFVFMHHCASEDMEPLVTGLIKGAFSFQGQKLTSTSFAMIPQRQVTELTRMMKAAMSGVKAGDISDPENYMGALLNEQAFEKTVAAIEEIRASDVAEIIAGGGYNREKGWFVEPTMVLTGDMEFKYLYEDIPGPVLVILEYKSDVREAAEFVSKQKFAMNCAVYHSSRFALSMLLRDLEKGAGSLNINSATTETQIGSQAIGGFRKSGTNSRLGSMLALIPWTNPRTIKDTLSLERKSFSYSISVTADAKGNA